MIGAALLLSSVPATNIPAGTERVPISATDLAEVADIMGPVASPDGRRVVYRVARPSVADNDTRLDWYIAEVDGGAPIHAASAGTVRHDGAGSIAEQVPLWDPDSRGFRYLALVDGVVSIWHWREDGGLTREVDDPADIMGFSLSRDGRMLRYMTGATRADVAAAERRAYREGILVDDSVDLGQPLAGGKIEGGKRIMQRWNRNWFDRAPILWDMPVKQKEVALTSGGYQGAPAYAPTPQGQKIALKDGGRAELEVRGDTTHLIVTRADGRAVECDAKPCRTGRLAAITERADGGTLILFEREVSTRERVWSWRIGAKAASPIAFTDGAERTPIWQPRCAIAATALVCAEASAIEPPRLVRIGFDGGWRTIDDPNAGLRGRISAVAVPMQWGNGHSGILLTPKASDRSLPLVIQYYRCAGFLKGGVGDEIPMLPLVENGIAVLCINGRYQPAGEPMDRGYAHALAAIENAVDDLAASGRIDPSKVGIGGLSFGSAVALWAIWKSRRFAAATLSSGQIGPHYYWSNALPDRGFAKTLRDYWKLGDPDSDAERWRELSPLWDVQALDTPLLIQAPESEVRNLVELHTKLKLARKPVELFAFADEIHIKYQPAHKRAVYQRNLDWYRFWLRGEEDAAPDKAGQYARWRGFRAGQSLQAPAR